jgi:hypothetical protein
MRHLLLPLLIASCLAAAAPEPIVIDSTHQLFLDDHLIASATNLKRAIHQPRKHESNPLLWPTEPWEPEMATVYGSVIRDDAYNGGKYRMWYKSGMGVAYAESDDGLRWTKPPLDFVTIDGVKTNILWRKKSKTEGPDDFPVFYELFGVHRDDREPDPSRRYKMGFLCIDWKHQGPGGDPYHPGQRRGLGVAASPDGLHWKLLHTYATEAIIDGQTHWTWDTARNKYVLYGRTRKQPPEIVEAWSKYDWFKKWYSGRAVGRVESPDFLTWSLTAPATAQVVLTPDLNDPPGTEIYSMKVFPYEGLYIGLVQTFHATPDDSTLDIQLAVSRDGINFIRVADRATWLPLGPVAAWDRFNLSMANNDPIRVGDDLRFYYGGRMYRHGPYAGKDKGPERSGIGLATTPRDRFVALQGSFDNPELLTKPLLLKGTTLHLNANARFGELTIWINDENGKEVGKSETITTDALAIPVKWKTDVSEVLAKPVTLRIRLKNAELFSLWTH